ncbi:MULTISPECIES: hypothetical protein [Clostridium]|uniref:hypothetical protein n=1 Tax=Clostridium TaxID=1485 RepID=UPI001AE3BD58|nr:MULTISPECIES: hypothetical protein [Clostridium]MBP1867507.1 hypothetical protein [Clostridium tertium]
MGEKITEKEITQQRFTCFNVNYINNSYSFLHVDIRDDNDFYENEDIWLSTHRKKNQYTWRKYDYKQKSNLFNLDSLYRKMPKKAFVKGSKN